MITPNNIKSLREARHLTQAQLAEQLGVSYQAVSAWENGLKTPRVGMLEKLSQIFQVSKAQVMGWEEADSAKEAAQDIQKSLDHILSTLENEQAALLFDGRPLDEETKKLLIASLEHSIQMAKIVTEEKHASH